MSFRLQYFRCFMSTSIPGLAPSLLYKESQSPIQNRQHFKTHVTLGRSWPDALEPLFGFVAWLDWARARSNLGSLGGVVGGGL